MDHGQLQGAMFLLQRYYLLFSNEIKMISKVDEDGFIVVSRSRRRRMKLSSRSGSKIIGNCNAYKAFSNVHDCTADEDEISARDIEQIITNACNKKEMIDYSHIIINLLCECLSGCKLSSIWAIGVGSFCRSWYCGRDQLALLLHLKEYFQCKVYFQEPCLTKEEKDWLCNHNICLSTTTDLLTCRLHDDIDEDVVLFYAPHCGHAVYNSVIYAHRKKLNRILIIGNNFHMMNFDTDCRTEHEGSNKVENTVNVYQWHNAMKLDSSELRALFLYSKSCNSLQFPILSSNFSAFNHTALHFQPENSPLLQIPEEIPRYLLYGYGIVI
ncbi:unnamed protein product [Thelazia callipaeda]|uniref:SRR1 domain-containing protein n=1 Tax=Thelazia callipaeda TaxID=103827 RepID=A0A0N5D0Y3_THECL|nr:unnamed protein product [Thelazia callipaeda]